MKANSIYLNLILSSLLLFSCSDSSPVDSDNNEPGASSKYVIAATPTALEDVADYLLTTESLTTGSVSTLDKGIEQDGTYRYYITSNNKLFSLLYGQGNPGAVTTYQLNEAGQLNQLKNYQFETVQAFTTVNDDILMAKMARNINDPYAYWYRVDGQTSEQIAEGQIDIIELAGNDEAAYFSWMTQVGNQVWAPFSTITGSGNNRFSTNYPDQARIAVYSYPEMELQKVIKDDRTSFIGRYFTKGLTVDEKGDVYAFSSAIAMNDNSEMISTKPSAITRIKDETTEFDPNYFFNLEKASGGYYATNHFYTSNGNFLVMMRKTAKKVPWSAGHHLAIINVYDKSFTWVEGLPDAKDIIRVTKMNSYVSEDGKTIHTGITTEEGSYVYAINVNSATATRGLKVKGGVITSILKLKAAE